MSALLAKKTGILLASFFSALLMALQPVLAQDEAQPEPDISEQSAEPVAAPDPLAPVQQQPSLEQAYQREFAFLQSQRRDLQDRLNELQARMDDERSGLEREIQQLERDVVEMGGRADRLDDLVFESELSVDRARENTDLLASTFMQADFTLEDSWNNDLGEQAPGAEDVASLFSAARDYLAGSSRVRRESGEFFLADGARVDGEIIRIGGIAAYGISDRGTGALAPAGDQDLKLWNVDTSAAAREVAAGTMPNNLPIFIYESLNNEVETRQAKGIFDVIRSGGVIGWIIFFLGLLGLILVILRAIFLQQASSSTNRVIDSVSQHVRRGDRQAALDVLKKKKGSTSRVVSAAIRNLDRDREHLEDIVSEAILHESTHLNRFGAFILVIAAVSPLLGLLGTVTGMISTFDVITEFGTGDPKLLSGGISIALVTTELGLIVAIPMLLLGNLLSGWAEGIKDNMEKTTLRIINQYSEGQSQRVGEPA
ncbi:MAG: MotA/TolQ/ExbB proton channel family protein [Pseudomonadota bacterium]